MNKVIYLALLINIGYSLSVGVEAGTTKCFYVDGKEQQQLTITYVVSGLQEDNVRMQLKDDAQRVIKELIKQREATLVYDFPSKGEYEICFQSTDSYFKLFSFDFDINGIDKNYALRGIYILQYIWMKDDVDLVNIKLRESYRTMQQVFRNQHYQFDRENVHSQLLQSTEMKVKWCALSKMIVLMIVCLVQIYLLTNFFKDKSFGPQV